MTDKQLILDTMRRMGKTIAEGVQARASELTGTQLNGEADYIPSFSAACGRMNMQDRPAGFVCRSEAGRVVKLLQPYDSSIYPQQPEELPAQWGFLWSTYPAHALPFISLSTSPYMSGDCCTDAGKTWRSAIDNNVWPPAEYPQGWLEVVP